MKSKFKILSLLLALSIILVACGQKTDSKEETVTESSKEETLTETLKEDISGNGSETKEDSKKETTIETSVEISKGGQIDVNKYIFSLYENKENKPFYAKSVGDQEIDLGSGAQKVQSIAEFTYDGKTLHNEISLNDQLKTDVYSVVENGELIKYSALNTGEGTTFFKEKTPFTGNIGLDFLSIIGAKNLAWKLESTDGDLQTYKAVVDSEKIREINEEQGVQFKDLQGKIDLTFIYNTKKQHVESLSSNTDYNFISISDINGKKTESKVVQKGTMTYKDFRFDNIEKVVIPEEALNAKESLIQ